MKKLIIAACAVALAGAVQAATYNWNVASTSGTYNGYDNTKVGTLSGATATAGLNWYLVYASTSQSDLLTSLRAGNSLSDSLVLKSGTTTSSTTAGLPSTNFTTDDSKFALQDGKISAYVVIFNTDKSEVYLGTTSAVVADTQGGTSNFSYNLNTTKAQRDLDGKTAYGSAGWYTIASVPEPTSGLLLLLGVAGLALRRRRA